MAVGKQRCMWKLAKFAHKCYKVTASCVYLCVCVCVYGRCTCHLLHVVLCTFHSCFCCFTTVVKSFVYLTTHVSTPTGWYTGHVSVAHRSSPTNTPHVHTHTHLWFIHTYMHLRDKHIYVHTFDCVVASIVGCARFRRLSACLSAVPTLVSLRKHLVVVYFSICKLICCFNVFFIAAFT